MQATTHKMQTLDAKPLESALVRLVILVWVDLHTHIHMIHRNSVKYPVSESNALIRLI